MENTFTKGDRVEVVSLPNGVTKADLIGKTGVVSRCFDFDEDGEWFIVLIDGQPNFSYHKSNLKAAISKALNKNI